MKQVTLEQTKPLKAYPGWTLRILKVVERAGRYYRGQLISPCGEQIEMRPTTYKPYLEINAGYYVTGFYSPWKEGNFGAN